MWAESQTIFANPSILQRFTVSGGSAGSSLLYHHVGAYLFNLCVFTLISSTCCSAAIFCSHLLLLTPESIFLIPVLRETARCPTSWLWREATPPPRWTQSRSSRWKRRRSMSERPKHKRMTSMRKEKTRWLGLGKTSSSCRPAHYRNAHCKESHAPPTHRCKYCLWLALSL